MLPVASGFDAAAGDELGGCFVTPACYAHMTHMLMTLANGKVAVCLEVGLPFVFVCSSLTLPPPRLFSDFSFIV
jgi:histone deacetylase 6